VTEAGAHGAHGAHDDHGGDHHGSPFVQHHYDDAQHQFDSGKLGIWLFLAQEVLFFSALFVQYILYRVHHPEIYSYAHKYLQVKFGAINTAVLIFSSLTAAWAVRCAQLRQRLGLIVCLVTTLLCACTFLCIKYIEYSHKVHEHILFGRYFDPCVSAADTPLLTKNNHCAGTKSTVDWDFDTGKPKEGCYDDAQYDLDPREPGVQADCKVVDQTVEFFTPPTITPGAGPVKTDCNKTSYVNVSGNNGTFEFTGTCDQIQIIGDHNKVKIGKVHKLEVQGDSNQVQGDGVDTINLYIPKPGPESTMVGFSARVDDNDPKPPEQRVQVATLNFDVGEHQRVVNAVAITDQCAEEEPGVEVPLTKPCWEIAEQPAVCGKVDTAMAARNIVKHIPEFGILVRYPDQEERGRNTHIAAACRPAAKPTDAGDVFADKPQHLQMGVTQLRTHPLLTEEQQFERAEMGPPPEHTNMFFTIYFAMTGLHGIHVLVGVLIFIWLTIRAVKGQFTPDYFGPIDYAALYWHIVDLIWIFLFPLLYLIH
jgi:heme/copper-type cytochrome/quinol oxidase subunit 3